MQHRRQRHAIASRFIGMDVDDIRRQIGFLTADLDVTRRCLAVATIDGDRASVEGFRRTILLCDRRLRDLRERVYRATEGAERWAA